MNISDPNTNTADIEIYTIDWNDIEEAETDDDNYLDEIENFFREDFENDTIEEEIF